MAKYIKTFDIPDVSLLSFNQNKIRSYKKIKNFKLVNPLDEELCIEDETTYLLDPYRGRFDSLGRRHIPGYGENLRKKKRPLFSNTGDTIMDDFKRLNHDIRARFISENPTPHTNYAVISLNICELLFPFRSAFVKDDTGETCSYFITEVWEVIIDPNVTSVIRKTTLFDSDEKMITTKAELSIASTNQRDIDNFRLPQWAVEKVIDDFEDETEDLYEAIFDSFVDGEIERDAAIYGLTKLGYTTLDIADFFANAEKAIAEKEKEPIVIKLTAEEFNSLSEADKRKPGVSYVIITEVKKIEITAEEYNKLTDEEKARDDVEYIIIITPSTDIDNPSGGEGENTDTPSGDNPGGDSGTEKPSDTPSDTDEPGGNTNVPSGGDGENDNPSGGDSGTEENPSDTPSDNDNPSGEEGGSTDNPSSGEEIPSDEPTNTEVGKEETKEPTPSEDNTENTTPPTDETVQENDSETV